jgi:phage baseplate assembly protein W
MPIKVKETKLEPNKKSVRVTLETPEGKEHEYTAKVEHVLDETIFKSLLHTWDRMIKEEEARVELKEDEIEKILKKREKMETKD